MPSQALMFSKTDGMDVSGKLSRDADKVSQLIARTKAFGSLARIYLECTVSTEGGRTWQEISAVWAADGNAMPALCRLGYARMRALGQMAGLDTQVEARRERAFLVPTVPRTVVGCPVLGNLPTMLALWHQGLAAQAGFWICSTTMITPACQDEDASYWPGLSVSKGYKVQSTRFNQLFCVRPHQEDLFDTEVGDCSANSLSTSTSVS